MAESMEEQQSVVLVSRYSGRWRRTTISFFEKVLSSFFSSFSLIPSFSLILSFPFLLYCLLFTFSHMNSEQKDKEKERRVNGLCLFDLRENKNLCFCQDFLFKFSLSPLLSSFDLQKKLVEDGRGKKEEGMKSRKSGRICQNRGIRRRKDKMKRMNLSRGMRQGKRGGRKNLKT